LAAKEGWGSRTGLVLAAAGNAVGLGNFLRFPAQAAQHGGGAFLIPYLVSFVLMGIPMLWIEWAIGRHGGRFGHHSAPGMFDRLGRHRAFKYLGGLGICSCVCVAGYYCYIESWTLAYVWHSIVGTFKTVPPEQFFPRYLGQHEASLFAFPREAVFWFLLTLTLNVWILSRGLAKGVELVAKIGMPLLIVFGAVLAIRGLTLPAEAAGVVESPLAGLNFVWNPRPSGLWDPTTWLAAAGQNFFTLSVGMGSIQCYAAYVKANEDIALNAASMAWMTEFVEIILGGSILIPIATAYLGLAAVQQATAGGSGFGLGFLTLPKLFLNWGWFAPVAGAMWFGLLFFAGITSSLAMGQPVIAFLEDELGVARNRAALLFGAVAAGLGFFCVCLYPGGAFDEFDFWTGTFALVVFALIELFIFAWVFGMDKGWDEITRGADMKVPRIFRYVIPYVTPFLLLFIFLAALVKPVGAWGAAMSSLTSGHGWPFAPDSVIGKLFHAGSRYVWFDAGGQATRELVIDLSRTLLAVVLAGCMAMIWRAWRRERGRAL
jgi:neurotransmitter:Na+ symporter, NSS family